jgi:hypothetical protein
MPHTQLTLDDALTDTLEGVYPKVANMEVPYTWERVDYLMGLHSPDFFGVGSARDWQWKRDDSGFATLLESLEQHGFLDPVFLFEPHSTMTWPELGEEVIGNGHHRIIAAHDLGYTHVPVTRDPDHRFRSSGPFAQ